MRKLGDKPANKLSTTGGQVLNLATVSTGQRFKALIQPNLYIAKHTAYTAIKNLFTHPKISFFTLLNIILSPVSTSPNTNTNLNKGLYS